MVWVVFKLTDFSLIENIIIGYNISKCSSFHSLSLTFVYLCSFWSFKIEDDPSRRTRATTGTGSCDPSAPRVCSRTLLLMFNILVFGHDHYNFWQYCVYNYTIEGYLTFDGLVLDFNRICHTVDVYRKPFEAK